MTVRLDFLVATTLAGITAAMPHMAISVEKFEKPNIIFSKAAEPPNVVFLLVDDMGYGDIAAHGNPVLKTPNFDKLHDQSARFTNFCVSPTCAPTRTKGVSPVL